MEREEISAGNQGKVKELVLFSLFTALTAIGAFYPCACTALPVHAAAFIYYSFGADFRKQERGGLRGSLCSSRSVGGSRFYAGRRAGIYFPAYFRLSFGVHRGSLAYGEIVGAYGKTVICPHFICEPGRTSCGLPFWNGLCIHHK